MINIFVTVGSGVLQFNRLVKACDSLDLKKYKILIQRGHSDYAPKNHKFIDYFKDNKDLLKAINDADLIIGHGGAGTIIDVLSKNKKLIVVPRLKKYGEVVDDHQLELAHFFEKQKKLYFCLNESELEKTINFALKEKNKQHNKNKDIVLFIEEYIKKIK